MIVHRGNCLVKWHMVDLPTTLTVLIVATQTQVEFVLWDVEVVHPGMFKCYRTILMLLVIPMMMTVAMIKFC